MTVKQRLAYVLSISEQELDGYNVPDCEESPDICIHFLEEITGYNWTYEYGDYLNIMYEKR